MHHQPATPHPPEAVSSYALAGIIRAHHEIYSVDEVADSEDEVHTYIRECYSVLVSRHGIDKADQMVNVHPMA